MLREATLAVGMLSQIKLHGGRGGALEVLHHLVPWELPRPE